MGRADFFKQYDNPDDFDALTYNGGPAPGFENVPWCAIDPYGEPSDFDDVLTSGYPKLPTDQHACKVSEEENAAGIQYTVVYFELEDPQWR